MSSLEPGRSVFNCGRSSTATEHWRAAGRSAPVGETHYWRAIPGARLLARGMPYRAVKGCLTEGVSEMISLFWDSKAIRALELAIAFLSIITALNTPA